MEARSLSRVEKYFADVIGRYGTASGVCSICITHLLPTTPPFLEALARLTELVCVLPKPKSVDPRVLDQTRRWVECVELRRERFSDTRQGLAFLEHRVAGRSLVILDVGGYFAPVLPELTSGFSGRIVGVVEDTENGLQRYERLRDIPCPVYSVARSPLKNAEDYLVGVSVVFSTEAVLRSDGAILEGQPAAVIGYGKIGRSVAIQLHSRHVSTTVYDRHPIRATEAMAHGFRVARSARAAVAGAGLVVCATGDRALGREELEALSNGAYVASVTSADDELGLTEIADYSRRWVAEAIEKYSRGDHYFYVLNEGNAVNFLHGATLGPAIYLLQGEILAAVHEIAAGDERSGLCEVDEDERRAVAALWLEYFADQ